MTIAPPGQNLDPGAGSCVWFSQKPGPSRGVADVLYGARESKFLLAQLRHSHVSGEKILVVCHGNIIRSLMPLLAGRDARESILIDLYHSSVSIIEVWKSGEAILKLANCVKHLLPKQVT